MAQAKKCYGAWDSESGSFYAKTAFSSLNLKINISFYGCTIQNDSENFS